MDKELEFLQNLFAGESEPIDLFTFLIKVVLTTMLSLIIGYCYVRFGNALSNRKALARNFALIALTTMLIITIVKSSLALSLGLVGALSIVRFRTAIKEPEELAYFFMVIGIGLGIGAGQLLVTIVGTFCLAAVIILLNRKRTVDTLQNLIIQLDTTHKKDLKTIISLIENGATQLSLNRIEETASITEVSFAVHFADLTALLTTREKLQEKYPAITFSFIELS